MRFEGVLMSGFALFWALNKESRVKLPRKQLKHMGMLKSFCLLLAVLTLFLFFWEQFRLVGLFLQPPLRFSKAYLI